jgi:DNA-binding MarR family transcriptional regulator
MDRDNGDDRLAAWMALLRAHAAATTALERALLEHCDLPLTWYEVLLTLRGSDGGMRMLELARSVLLSKSGLTRAVDRMQAAGLVERRACDTDRRITYVALTPAGQEMLERATPVQLDAVKAAFTDHLTPEELTVLARALDRVAVAGGTGPTVPCDLAMPEAPPRPAQGSHQAAHAGSH